MNPACRLRLFILFLGFLNSSALSNCHSLDSSQFQNAVNIAKQSVNNKSRNLNAYADFSDSCHSYFTEHETLNGAFFYSTIYGDFLVEEPLIIELIKSPEMQRLKKINQYGIDYYAYKPEIYTRFQHSICVYLLTKKYAASLKEQVAALLHDVSHTFCSHSLDFLLKEDLRMDSYQDDILDIFLQNSSIKGILEKYKLTTKDVSNKNSQFKILDQPVPDLCTDRIEYNLYGGFVEGILTPFEIKTILADLKFENGLWHFDTVSSARLLAYFALYLTDTRLAGYDNAARNSIFTKILEHAFELNIITCDDIHSSTDDVIWSRLRTCNDSFINSMLTKLADITKFYTLDKQNYDVLNYPKFRAVDPFIKTEKGLFRLTNLDQAFKDDYETLRTRISEGIPIKFRDSIAAA